MAAAFVALLVVLAIAGPWIAPHPPNLQSLRDTNAGPFAGGHVLGTDALGRDILSRLIVGVRVALIAPLIALGIGFVIGVPLGYVAGFYRGRIETVIMRCTDVLMTFPALILAVAVVGVRGPGIVNAMVAIGVLFIPRFIRLVRGSVIAVREETYVEAARSLGASDRMLITREIVPNTLSPIVVQLTTGIGTVILAESALSFLGLSVRPPEASWGVMLQEAFTAGGQAGWSLVWPGLAIMLTVLAFGSLGDALNRRLAGRSS